MITDQEMDSALKVFWFRACEAAEQEKRPQFSRKLKALRSAVYDLQGDYEKELKPRSST